MKYLIIFAAFIAQNALAAGVSWYTTPVSVPPKPEVSTCYSIVDPDARTMCRAVVKRDPSICYAIPNPDTRAVCRVRALQ